MGSAKWNGTDFEDLEPGDKFDAIEWRLRSIVGKKATNEATGITASIASMSNANELARHGSIGENEEAHKFAAKNVLELFRRATIAVEHEDKYGHENKTRRFFTPFYFMDGVKLAVITVKGFGESNNLYAIESLDIIKDASDGRTSQHITPKDGSSAPLPSMASFIKDKIAYYVGDVNSTKPRFLTKGGEFSVDKLYEQIKDDVDAFSEQINEKIKRVSSYIPTADGNKRFRSWITQPRGGVWTKEKILRNLKKSGGTSSGQTAAINQIRRYESPEDMKEHMFYHGSARGSSNLIPSIAMSDKDYERIGFGGGGNGQKYWAISVSKSKRVASGFSGAERGVNIYPILLKKGAKVVDMPNIQDSAELEDIIEQLWSDGVDAVKIGDWNKESSEQELAVLNPKAIVNVNSSQYFDVLGMGKKDLGILTDEQIEDLYNAVHEAAKRAQAYDAEHPFELESPEAPDFKKYINGEIDDKEYERQRAEYEKARDQYLKDLNQWRSDRSSYANYPNIRFCVSVDRERAQREYDEIVERYTNADGSKKPGWMQTPNGKPTNLTERQWVLVRTPLFKRWFGDWETLAEIKAVNEMSPVDIKFNEHIEDKKISQNIFASFGYVENIFDGRKVRFPTWVVEKINGHKGFDTTSIYKSFDVLFKNAIPGWSENEKTEKIKEGHKPHPNIDECHHYVSRIKDKEGTDWFVLFTVTTEKARKGEGESLVHSSFVSEVEVYKAKGADPSSILSVSNRAKSLSAPLADNILSHWFNSVNPSDVSKVVDDNGEPKVVYHGTRSIYAFNAFDGKSFFTDDRKVAEMFHSEAAFVLSIDGREMSLDNASADELARALTSGDYNADEISNWEDFELSEEERAALRDAIETGAIQAGISQEEIDAAHTLKLRKNDNGLFEVFLNIRSPHKVDFGGRVWESDDDFMANITPEADGVIATNIREGGPVAEIDGEDVPPSTDYIAFSPTQIKSATDNIGTFDGENENIRYSIVTDNDLLDKLNSEETIKVYRAMQLIDGKLYPPMSARINGKLREPIELDKWEQAEENPDLADDKGYFKLDKAHGKAIKARYNPYFHTSPTPLNDQFASAQDRPNLVTVEVEVPKSELTSGYKAEKAKNPVGYLEWKAGVIQSKISGNGKRSVILSRWDKPVRIVPDSEVADKIIEMFGEKKITMPSNVVTPSLRSELEKRGVPFIETDNNGRIVGKDIRLSVNRVTPDEDAAYMDAVRRGDMETAQRMVEAAERKAGYSHESNYQGTSSFNGRAPSESGYYADKEERLEALRNNEFEGDVSLGDMIDVPDSFVDGGIKKFAEVNLRYGGKLTKASAQNILNVINSGKRTIKIYRSIPADIKETKLRNGDWVTPSREYAQDNANIHGWKGKIIEQEVDVDSLWWDGNDINEWGFDDGNRYAYKDTANNVKSLAPVTYDDAGNVIPLSQRFNQ